MPFNASEDAASWFENTGADAPHSEAFLSEVFHERWMVFHYEMPDEIQTPDRYYSGDPEDMVIDEEKYKDWEDWCVGHPQYHSDCIEWIGYVQEVQEDYLFFVNQCGSDWHSYYGVSRSDFS